MRSHCIFLACIWITFLSCKNASNPGNDRTTSDPQLSTTLDSIGESYVQIQLVKGLSIAVGASDEILYSAGFGFVDSLNSAPVTSDHVFLLASISKLVGSAMVMKLVEEGKLSLDQTLLELLPDYPNPEHARKITLRHLLSHTSGLMDYAMDIDPVWLETGKHPDKADYYRFFRTHPLFFEPGQFYSYSNSGFLLMAMIIERVTGNAFQSEIDRVINRPAGVNVRLIANRIGDPRLSDYFELVDSTLQWREHWPWIKGDGGLTTSAVELAKFPFYWSNGTIISTKSFETMITPVKLNNGITTGYGLGVRTGTFEGEKVIGHTGGNKSGFAMMMYLPERHLSIVVMVNTDNTPTDAITIMGPVALAVLGKDWPDPVKEEVPVGDLSQYEGTFLIHEYKKSSFDTLVSYVNPADNHLYMKFKGSQSDGLKYYAAGGHAFTYEAFPMDRTVFEMGTDGKAVAFKNHWNGMFQRMGFSADLFKEAGE